MKETFTMADEAERHAAELGEPIETVLLPSTEKWEGSKFVKTACRLSSWSEGRAALEKELNWRTYSPFSLPGFVAWTASHVLFVIVNGDRGGFDIRSVPRNPTEGFDAYAMEV